MMQKIISDVLCKLVTVKMFFTYIKQLKSLKKESHLQNLTDFSVLTLPPPPSISGQNLLSCPETFC